MPLVLLKFFLSELQVTSRVHKAQSAQILHCQDLNEGPLYINQSDAPQIKTLLLGMGINIIRGRVNK